MNSLRFTLSILCVYSTVNTSYAAGDRTGNVQNRNGNHIYFPVRRDARITTSGEIKVSVAEIGCEDPAVMLHTFHTVTKPLFNKITNEPLWLEFPFTKSPKSTDYYSIRFNCILTATEVKAFAENPYHWDFTFKLFKGFIVDSQNSQNKYEIFATDTLSKAENAMRIGNIVLNKGTIWILTDEYNKPVPNIKLADISIWYMGSDDPTGTAFIFITFTKE